MKQMELYTPRLCDLGFRKRLLEDPATMGYNKGYALDFPGYHRDTGCISFPEECWENWYSRWVNGGDGRFYAYLRRKADGAFLGEVSLREEGGADRYEMGIVLLGEYRGMGYGREGMSLLLDTAFLEMGAKAVSNRFEPCRKAAWKLHREAGFQQVGEEAGVASLLLTREKYLESLGDADLNFGVMQELQRKLQEKYLDKWGGLSPKKGRDTLLWMIIEAGEAADVIKKQGDQAIVTKGETRSHFVEELCDVMMYFNDLLLCYGITPKEFSEIYWKKHRRNMTRWDDNGSAKGQPEI